MRLIIVAILTSWVIVGCNSQKHIHETSVSFDSTYEKSLEDSVRVLKSENDRLYQQIHESQYAGVTFNTNCDSIINSFKFALANKLDPKTADSLINIISGLQSKIKYYADGSYEITGQLQSAYTTTEKLTTTISEKQKTIDSLEKRLESDKNNVKTVVQTKEVDKEIKTPFPWLWLAVIFIAGIYVRKYGISKVPLLNKIL